MIEVSVLLGTVAGRSARFTSQSATESINALKAIQPLAADSGLLIVCTSTPDFPLPTTACMVQQAAELPTAIAALDLRGGAETFISAITLASGMIRAGGLSGASIVTADTDDGTSQSNRALATAAWLSVASAEKFRCATSVDGSSGNTGHELVLLALSKLLAGAGTSEGQRSHVILAGVAEAHTVEERVRSAMSSVALSSLEVSERQDAGSLPELVANLSENDALQHGDLVMLVAVSEGSVASGLVLEW